jgi:Flp pilus assembly protein CpaB
VTTSPIVEGQQVSIAQIAGTETESVTEDGLATVLDLGRVGFTMGANEVSNVAGFVQAGDYVNVVAVYAIDDSLDSNPGGAGINERPYTRVETLLQNVEVLAVAQLPVDAVPAPDAASTGTEGDAAANVSGAAEDTGSDRQRPDEIEPNPGATTVTVHLSLDEAQVMAAARAEGELFLELRALGDTGTQPVEVLCFDKFGRFPCPVVAR